jgi:hypothetical protein
MPILAEALKNEYNTVSTDVKCIYAWTKYVKEAAAPSIPINPRLE